MPADVLRVVLEGRQIGRLERSARGDLRFQYEEAVDPAGTPLSVSMPLGEAHHGDARIAPWLWGILPENADVLASWGRRFGVSVVSPFPLLTTPVGRDCPGAVQFFPPGDFDTRRASRGDVVWQTEAQVAQLLRDLRSDASSWLGRDFVGRFSLAGAQAKTALHFAEGRWGVPTGRTPTTHILKPGIPGFEHLALNEHLCLRAAAVAGLHATRSRIMAFEDQIAVVVTRFDRTHRDGSLIRVHQEDLCQALGVHPARKYQADGGPTPRNIADLLRSCVAGSAAAEDVWRFADALAVNWLIGGTDAHAKNYSLLLAGPRVRLAPLYDVASMLPYDDSHGHKLRLAMKIGREYRLRRTDRPGAWARLATELGVDADLLLRRVLGLARRLPEALEQAISGEGVDDIESDLPSRLLELLSARALDCARSLEAG